VLTPKDFDDKDTAAWDAHWPDRPKCREAAAQVVVDFRAWLEEKHGVHVFPGEVRDELWDRAWEYGRASYTAVAPVYGDLVALVTLALCRGWGDER